MASERAAAPVSRADWVRAALSYVGLEPTDPQYVRRVYLAHLPGEGTELQRAQAKQMAVKQYGCGLVREAISRDVGVTWPHLRRWYGESSRIGGVIRDMVKAARAEGSWVDATKWRPGDPLFRPGDAVLIGGPAPEWSHGKLVAEHVLTVTSVDGPAVESIDGGQPGVATRARVLVQTPQGELWLADSGSAVGADGRPETGRRVQGWIDVDKTTTEGGAEGGEKPAPAAPPPAPGAGGASGGGGASGSWQCPPCGSTTTIPVGGPLGVLDFLLLAFLLGELSGQEVEGYRKRRGRR